MEKLCLLLVVLIPAICKCQTLPVKLNVHSEQLDEHSYILLMSVQIEDGWHVYAKTDTALGIDPLTIKFGNNNLEFDGEETAGKPTQVVDALFGNKPFSVYVGRNVFEKTIKVSDQNKYIVVWLEGIASNDKKVVNIKICRLVDLKNGVSRNN